MKEIEKAVAFSPSGNVASRRGSAIRKSDACPVRTFADLVEKVAELSFQNPEHLLFFRGQAKDHRNGSGQTSVLPSLFRPQVNERRLSMPAIERRFQTLDAAEDVLYRRYERHRFAGRDSVRKFSILRWALLQHYEVCATPLLDLTHSLRVACSFAYLSGESRPHLFVLALPQVSGSVTTSSEHGLQIIRLLSICPPTALRPHYQEGYLVGEFPTLSHKQKMLYKQSELDFGCRLVSKFRLPEPNRFWRRHFSQIPPAALFPDRRDELVPLMKSIRDEIDHLR